MALAIVSKLERLPDDAQTLLKTLSTFELRSLRAALSPYVPYCLLACISANLSISYDAFDFLLLPRELRDKVYSHDLFPSWELDTRESLDSPPRSGLSRASKQLPYEMRDIWLREATVNLKCDKRTFFCNGIGSPYSSGHMVVNLKKVLSHFRIFRVKYEFSRRQIDYLESDGSIDEETNLTRRQSRLSELLCLLKQVQQSQINAVRVSLTVKIFVDAYSTRYPGAADQEYWHSITRRVVHDTMTKARKYMLDENLQVTMEEDIFYRENVKPR